jgi:hypothetical protein
LTYRHLFLASIQANRRYLAAESAWSASNDIELRCCRASQPSDVYLVFSVRKARFLSTFTPRTVALHHRRRRCSPRHQLSGYVLSLPPRSIFNLFYLRERLQNVRRSTPKARRAIYSVLSIRTMLCLEIISTSQGSHNACFVADNDSR